MKRVMQAIFVFLLAVGSLGAAGDIEQRFSSVGHKMVCTCSCTQILLECNHVGCPVSPVMIGELKTQLAGGGGDTSIFNWFAAKYGPTVLAAPIRGGFDNVAWIVPASLFAVAIAFTVWLSGRWKRRTVPAMAGAPHVADDLRDRIRRQTEY